MNLAVEMAKRLMVDSIWKSAVLEGLGTTFPRTEMILENLPVNTSREEVLFIWNMRSAWKFLLELIESGYRENNLSVLEKFNSIVGSNLFYECGKIRTLDVSIGGTIWKPEIPCTEKIVQKLREIDRIKDVERRCIEMFCYVARSQIFIDGNKRVAQLIANKILIENGLGIFQIPNLLVEDFKVLLLKYYETGNINVIYSFMKKNCILRVGEVPTFSVSEFSDFNLGREEINELGVSELDRYSSILKPLISSLRNIESDKLLLYERDNIIFLDGKNLQYRYSLVTRKSTSNIKNSDLLDKYVLKTLESIENKIVIPIKRINFAVVDEFTYGVISRSEDELGYCNVILR